MITRISEKLAHKLGQATGRIDQIDDMRYGFEVAIGGTLNPLILFVLAWALGVLKVCLWLAVTFAVFRIVMGGYHFVTYWRCLMVTIFSLLGCSLLAKQLSPMLEGRMDLLIIGIGIVALVFSVYLAPANGRYMDMTVIQKNRLRKASIYISIIWTLGMLVFAKNGLEPMYLLSSMFGVTIQVLTMPTSFMNVLGKFEGIMTRR